MSKERLGEVGRGEGWAGRWEVWEMVPRLEDDGRENELERSKSELQS